LKKGIMQRKLLVNGIERSYELHLPARRTKVYFPLVLLFHGRGRSGNVILSRTGFAAKADAEGFMIAAPDGINGHWNDGRGTVNPDVDDVGFIRELVVSLKSEFPIDIRRIYAAGSSNGGIFTQRLACEFSDVLTAIATVAGPLPTNVNQSRPNPISVVGIQGDEDPRVPIDGVRVSGKVSQIESAFSTMNFWASINSCYPAPTVTHIPPTINDTTSVDKYVYSGGLADVVYYIVRGMGHAWPPYASAESEHETGVSSQNIVATDVIWDFFHQHSKPPSQQNPVLQRPERPFLKLEKLRRAKGRRQPPMENEPQ
jgi:polyhydroxybutyrate depolymerase